MNGYILNTAEDTNIWGSYNHNKSISHLFFLKGKMIQEEKPMLFYEISRKIYIEKVKTANILISFGVLIVNEKVKTILQKYVPTYNIQFFDINIYCKEEFITKFYAVNICEKIPCIDIENSEYRITNFDPQNPSYMFYYMKLRKNIFQDFSYVDMAICKEMELYIIVSDKIKKIFFEENIKGVSFSDSIDLTYNNRAISEIIS
ncbi:imm11 family protein [Capnocytophaga canimorsus]|uniref:imm11 family protein n=1 Tax=Capnocytophaga canimorsus TaxID=28188 RepID=UPI0037D3D9BA